MSKQGKPKKKKGVVSYAITIVCLTVFVYAAYSLLSIFYDYYRNDKVLSGLQDIYYEELEGEGSSHYSGEKRVRPGFEGLKEVNDDMIGWLTIDNTNIDYPILQADNNTAYLNRNYYGDKSIAGSIFMDYRNNVTMNEKNYILYGHRVKDGSMFQHLTKYLEQDFFEDNRTFTFDTLYDSYEAEIFAVYNTMIDFNYIETDFDDMDEYQALLDGIYERSIYTTDVDVSVDDQIITLSTCEYTLDPDDSRLVVHAKLKKIE